GAGTFGLSTAWHLARRGYTNIVVVDRHEAPSTASAGNDLNKIFRTEYSTPSYSKLALEAREAWLSEEILREHFHENGYIFAVCDRDPQSQRWAHLPFPLCSVKNYEEAVLNSRLNGIVLEDLTTPEDFRRHAPFLDGPLENWRGVFNARAGWTHAAKSLLALTTECRKLGVKFIGGVAGTMERVYMGEGDAVSGVEMIDGSILKATTVILATGGWTDSILDTKGQLHAKGWCFAHIKLSQEEAKIWRKAPVINNRELGYMFEPDYDNSILKYTNLEGTSRSTPRSQAEHPTDTMPHEVEDLIRAFLRECVPSLAHRPFCYERICWDADSPDSHFLIDEHPEHPGLFMCAGGSGHAFKFLPIIGSYICDRVEGKLVEPWKEAWRWRPGVKRVVDTARPPRPSPDLADMPGWKHDE
ncbi:putative fructosyl amino acid oxidase, partial [Meredithblackwellia eburnea MCA 4105]